MLFATGVIAIPGEPWYKSCGASSPCASSLRLQTHPMSAGLSACLFLCSSTKATSLSITHHPLTVLWNLGLNLISPHLSPSDWINLSAHLGHPAEVTLSRTQLPSAAPLRVTSAASQLGWAEQAGLWLSCIQLSLVLGSAKPSSAQLGNSWLS